MNDIKQYGTFAKIEPINKGWSEDKKFYIETTDNRRLLLRVADIAEYDRKKSEYGMMERAAALGIPMSAPVDFGMCNGGKSVYSLLTWCDGEDAEAALPRMTEDEQYNIGVKSGALLRKLHSIPIEIDESAASWGERFREKVRGRAGFYNSHPIKCADADFIIHYLHENQKLLDSREVTFNHGDYGASNIIVTPTNDVGVIDFNSFNLDCGDPWWEFTPAPWGHKVNAHFITGQINGYFGDDFSGKLYDDFFAMHAYYSAYDALTALCCTADGEGGEPEEGRIHMSNILKWFDNFRTTVPSWYMTDLRK